MIVLIVNENSMNVLIGRFLRKKVIVLPLRVTVYVMSFDECTQTIGALKMPNVLHLA